MNADQAATGGTMRVSVVSPERILFEGDATAVVVPAYDGLVGILPHHAPFMTILGSGPLVIRHADGETRFTVYGGFLQVVGNAVRVVAEKAENSSSAPGAN